LNRNLQNVLYCIKVYHYPVVHPVFLQEEEEDDDINNLCSHIILFFVKIDNNKFV